MVSNLKSNKMKCKHIHKELIFYIDNELSEEKRITIEKHLESCADCRSFLSFLKEEMHLIAEEKKPEVSPYFYTRLSARLHETPDYQIQSAWLRIAQPAFFTLLLIAGIYGGLRLGTNASSVPNFQPAQSTFQFVNDFKAEPIESFLLEEL